MIYQSSSSLTKASIVAFVLSIIIPLTWYASQSIDVYHFKAVGAIFEIIWWPIFFATICPTGFFLCLLGQK
jgi:hypothetical protein